LSAGAGAATAFGRARSHTQTPRCHAGGILQNASMNTRFFSGIAAGCVVGFVAGWFLHPAASDSSSKPDEGAAARIRIAQLESDLKSRTAALDRLTVASRKEELDKQSDSERTKRNASNAPNAQRMQDRMKKKLAERQKLKLDEKVATLRTRLKLTDDQAAAVRELIEKSPEGMQSMIARAMSGEKMDEKAALSEMLKPGQKSAELDGKITALLTPEQQQDYTAFRQEQRSNDVEVKANKELARLQGSLTLSPEQKDKAFATLTKLANEEYDNPVNNMAAMMQQQMKLRPPNKPEMKEHMAEINAAADFAAERRKMRVDAMREVLTPEQLAIYETQQKQISMADMMDSTFGDVGTGFFMGGDDEEPAPGEKPGASAPSPSR
jgi:hypothetical protein